MANLLIDIRSEYHYIYLQEYKIQTDPTTQAHQKAVSLLQI